MIFIVSSIIYYTPSLLSIGGAEEIFAISQRLRHYVTHLLALTINLVCVLFHRISKKQRENMITRSHSILRYTRYSPLFSSSSFQSPIHMHGVCTAGVKEMRAPPQSLRSCRRSNIANSRFQPAFRLACVSLPFPILPFYLAAGFSLPIHFCAF